MKTDVIKLLNNSQDRIEIDETLSFDQSYIEYTDIQKLDKVNVTGNIAKNYENNIVLNLNVSGNMIILDALSNDEVNYPFNIEIIDQIVEIDENNQNTLDIMSLLWENIVLEVPSRYTTVTDTENLKGDGWRLVSEEDLDKGNNPFSTLKEMEGVDNNGSPF